MWKLVFSLLVVVGILELVSPAKMTDTAVNRDGASGPAGPSGESGKPGGTGESGQGGNNAGSGAQNMWLSGGHAVAALLVLVLCLQ
ncbi:hypothetical protein SprV_0602091300 [Sparganum proliferum]